MPLSMLITTTCQQGIVNYAFPSRATCWARHEAPERLAVRLNNACARQLALRCNRACLELLCCQLHLPNHLYGCLLSLPLLCLLFLRELLLALFLLPPCASPFHFPSLSTPSGPFDNSPRPPMNFSTQDLPRHLKSPRGMHAQQQQMKAIMATPDTSISCMTPNRTHA